MLTMSFQTAAEPSESADRVLPNQVTSDERLWEHFAKTGCARSFNIINDRYWPRVRGFILRRIGDEATADDLTQQVFVRILRNKAKFDPARNFSTWCHTIANNVLKNHYRGLSRNRIHCFTDVTGRSSTTPRQRPADPVYDVQSRAALPDVEAYREELRVELRRTLMSMDPKYREPFFLHVMRGYSYQEVSEQLGESVGTVKARAQKVRSELREVLAVFRTDHDVSDIEQLIDR